MAEAVRHDKTARQLRLLSDALDSGRLGPVRRLVNTLAPAEIGNLLESLPPGKREVVWGLVDPEDDGEVLLHVGDEVRESLLADMDPDEIVAAVEDLDIDDLANLVEDLPDTVIDEVLKSMDRENRERSLYSVGVDSRGRGYRLCLQREGRQHQRHRSRHDGDRRDAAGRNAPARPHPLP